jgi:hypothetical protein
MQTAQATQEEKTTTTTTTTYILGLLLGLRVSDQE